MRLEHVLSPEAEARLDSILPQSSALTLDRVPARTRVRILQIQEGEPDLLRHLHSLGLLPEAEVAVEEVAPFGGPLLVRVGHARYAIGQEIAATVVVQRALPGGGPQRVRHRERTGR
jgi:DtxR family Mn-dependent transcriptional regulator